MDNYLIGKGAPPEDEFLDQLNEYYLWNQQFLGPLMSHAKKIEDPVAEHDTANEFTFHQVNGPLTFMWHQLLYKDAQRYDTRSLYDIQTHLAVSVTPSVQRLQNSMAARCQPMISKSI